MLFSRCNIPDVMEIQPVAHGDHRGFLMETWRKDLFQLNGLDHEFVQDNHSKSGRGILRGLHYQFNRPQGKLVRVIAGEIFDVAVDLRRSSATFGQHVGRVLSDENKIMLWIPPGFAHGFYVLSASAEIAYKCTEYYSPEDERTILWNDKKLKIDWPLLDQKAPVLSKRDQDGTEFNKAETYP